MLCSSACLYRHFNMLSLGLQTLPQDRTSNCKRRSGWVGKLARPKFFCLVAKSRPLEAYFLLDCRRFASFFYWMDCLGHIPFCYDQSEDCAVRRRSQLMVILHLLAGPVIRTHSVLLHFTRIRFQCF